MFGDRGQMPSMPTLNSPTKPLSAEQLCQLGTIVGAYGCLYLEKRPCRTSPLSGDMYIKELLTSNEWRILEVFRMPKEIFLGLCDWMRGYGWLKATKKVTVEEQVAIFLAVVGHSSTNREVQERFQVSGSTVTT